MPPSVGAESCVLISSRLFTPRLLNRYESAAAAYCAVVGPRRNVSFEPSESGDVSEANVLWMTGMPAALIDEIEALRPAEIG